MSVFVLRRPQSTSMQPCNRCLFLSILYFFHVTIDLVFLSWNHRRILTAETASPWSPAALPKPEGKQATGKGGFCTRSLYLLRTYCSVSVLRSLWFCSGYLVFFPDLLLFCRSRIVGACLKMFTDYSCMMAMRRCENNTVDGIISSNLWGGNGRDIKTKAISE